MRKTLILILFYIFSYPCNGQKKEVKFGIVSPLEVQMDRYEQDSAAHAVILYDHGRFDGTEGKFIRHVRIKILTTAGTSFSNFTIRSPAKSDIRGFIYNYEMKEISRTKLDNENIYKEEVTNSFGLYKIFFPNVRVGTVIDLEYSHYGLPFEWCFQDIISTVHSELILEDSRYITYKKVFYGFEQIKTIRNNHWIAKDIPALRQEPFMSHYSNYLTKFQFDIESITIPGYFNKDFSSSWQKVGEYLLESEYFGVAMRQSPFLNEIGKTISESRASNSEKVMEAFNYIKGNIKWNKVNSLFVTRGYRENFTKNHSGNSAEINLMLVALLNKSGLNAYPVVLSTRENGLINPMSASLNKLNYVIASVKIENDTLLLDATTPHTMPGILPEWCLNYNGWLVDKTSGAWVNLVGNKISSRKQYIRIYPDQLGKLIAEITNTHEGFAYLDWIEDFEKAGSEESFAKYLNVESKMIEFDDYQMKFNDKEKSNASETIKVNLSASNYFEDLGNEVIINPFLLNDLNENPFKSEHRKFPVDFIYPQKRTITISMTVPENYTVISIPEYFKMVTPDNSASFTFLSQSSNNMISMQCNLIISKSVFTESEYPIMRNFFSEVIKKFNQYVQLKKKI